MKCTILRGYSALICVLILSAILIGVSFSSSTLAYFARFSTLDMEYQQAAELLADSCISMVMLRLSQNDDYRPNYDVIPIDSKESCVIDTVSVRNNVYTAQVHARIGTVQYKTSADLIATSSDSFFIRVHPP